MLITLAFIIWVLCAVEVSMRDVERLVNMSIFKLFLWMTSVALFSPLVLVYDLIKHGWYNNK